MFGSLKASALAAVIILSAVAVAHGASPSQIKVLTFDSSGAEIFGYAIELWPQNGTVLSETCFSPCAFTVTNGDKNLLYANDFGPQCFNHWADGSRERFENVTIDAADSSTSVAHNAVYAACSATPQLTVSSQDQFSATITGYFTVLFNDDGSQNSTGFTPVTFTVNANVDYSVQVQSFGGCTFARWADTGKTDAARAVTISSDTSLLATYNCA